jgi:M6 family metalloprotease-like protein
MPTKPRLLAAALVACGAFTLLHAAPAPALDLPRPLAPTVDVTAESGARLIGRPVAWTSTADGRAVEHLAGRSAAGQLVVLSWSADAGRWSAEDVSARIGHRFASDLTAWRTADGPYTVEHLAGRTTDGSLVVAYRSTRDDRWKTVDVTARTGRGVATTPTSWQTRNGQYNVEHLAARDPAGNVLVFWWSPAHDWQVLDVSAATGRRISSPLTSWQRRTGSQTTEFLAGSAADGAVTVFSWSPSTDWRAQVLPQRLAGGVTAWHTGSVEHLAGARADGSLITLWRNGGTTWHAVDVTAITAERVVGTPAVYQLADGGENVEVLGSRNPGGHLVLHWWKPSRDWQALDLSDINGRSLAGSPAGWLTTSGTRTIEHLAAVDADGRLRVTYSFDQPRTLTDRIAAPAFGISYQRHVARKVLVVLWQAKDQNDPRPTAPSVDAGMFGSGDSVRRYFEENSGGTFALGRAGTLGWYESDKPLSYYDNPDDRHDKMGAALLAADPDVDYRQYDTDRDGTLEPSELGLVFAHPSQNPGGLIRSGGRRIMHPDGGALVLDGVRITDGAELALGSPANHPVIAHELSHLLANLPDMYPPNVRGESRQIFTPTRASKFSLMDNTYDPFHLDPLNKLKLGWARPRLIFRGGRYTLPDIETRRRVLVLVDPARGLDEYYLVENRLPGTGFDRNLPDRGLGVWHIMERQADWDAAPPPPTVSSADWAETAGQLGVRAIRMVRPVLTKPLDDSRALWDGSDPVTGYDLVSQDPDPLHPSLRWADRAPSGFALRAIGPPGANVAVTIDVP